MTELKTAHHRLRNHAFLARSTPLFRGCLHYWCALWQKFKACRQRRFHELPPKKPNSNRSVLRSISHAKDASHEGTSDCAARQRKRIISQSELADWRSTTAKRVSCGTFRGHDGRQLSLGDQRFGRSHFRKRSRGKLQSDQVAKRTVARN